MKTVKLDPEFVEFASVWHDGQSSMLYAISSTGALSLGTDRPVDDENIPLTNNEWMLHLVNNTLSELFHIRDKHIKAKHADYTTLLAFINYLVEVAGQLETTILITDIKSKLYELQNGEITINDCLLNIFYNLYYSNVTIVKALKEAREQTST